MDKVHYLEKENQQLRGELADLKQLLKMNKIQIDVLSSQFETPQTKNFIEILYKNRQFQQKLQQKLSNAHRETKELMAQNFMLKQMNEEQKQQMKAIQILNNNSFRSFQDCIKEMEDKIGMMQKFHKDYDKVSGFVLKNRNIIAPAQLSLQLKQKQYQIDDQLYLMKAELQLAKNKQENLMLVNTVLRNKIVSLQAKLAMPNRNLGEVLDRSLKRLMVYFIEVQKKIITGDQQSDSQQEDDIELIAPELSGIFPQKQLRIQKDYNVPHLDLLKIREQITQGIPKIKDALAARNHLTDKQKVQKLQVELEYTRRQLSKNIIDLKLQKNARKAAQRALQQIQNRNLLLTNSNLHLEQKVKKYWDQIQFIMKNKQNNPIQIDQFNDGQATVAQIFMRPNSSRKNNNIHTGLNQSDQINYKVCLQLLAKQLEDNKKLVRISELKNKNEQNGPKMKRSTSNPLLYFNQRKQQIMEIKNQKDDNQRLQQTCYQHLNDGKFQEDLDGLDV